MKNSENNVAVKKEAPKAKAEEKYEGVVAVSFKVKNKIYSKGDVYLTSHKRSFDYLIEQRKINPKNNKR